MLLRHPESGSPARLSCRAAASLSYCVVRALAYILVPKRQFRLSVSDVWVTHACKAPTLFPAREMKVGGHVRSLTPLHRFRQSLNDSWVTRAFEAPTCLKRACDPVAPSWSYASGRTRALSDFIALIL